MNLLHRRFPTRPSPAAQGQATAPVAPGPATAPAAPEADVRRAYAQGRTDERRRRRVSPLLTFVLVLVAAAGAFILYLAAREGSFGRAGQLVDQHISGATQATQQAAQNAANRAGNALQAAGSQLKRSGG